MGKFRYRLSSGLAFFENRDIKMMEKMALEGYTLRSVNGLGFYRFEAAAPETVTYSIDFSEVRPGAEEFEAYLEVFKGSGWEYVFSLDKLHWFKASKGTTPLYTDGVSESFKYLRMFRLSLKYVVICLLLALALFALSLILDKAVSLPEFIFASLWGVAGGFIGIAIAMTIGTLLNLRRVAKLQR
jgi:hypothetical protein